MSPATTTTHDHFDFRSANQDCLTGVYMPPVITPAEAIRAFYSPMFHACAGPEYEPNVMDLLDHRERLVKLVRTGISEKHQS